MMITPFFLELRTGYAAELEDLTHDSEGRDVLRQRLADKRKELDFLLQMMRLSPEMVAVIFHRSMRFKLPALMADVLGREADELPEWDAVAAEIEMAPWAQPLAERVLQEEDGPWFMTVVAALEYMASQPHWANAAEAARGAAEDEEDDEYDSEDDDGAGESMHARGHRQDDDSDGADDNEHDAKTRHDAGNDWMAGQGFDRKD